MFKINRVEKGQENVFRLEAKEGSIEIRGTGDFLISMFNSLCEESTVFLELLRENLKGETTETVAQKMRESGFPDDVVRDFENGEFWDDIIID